MVAVIGVLFVGALQKETRPSFKKIVAAFEETGKILLDIAVITALAGIVIGALHLSGFTFKISLLLVTLSGNNCFFYSSPLWVVCSSACRCRPRWSTSPSPFSPRPR